MFCYRDYQLTTRFNQQKEKSTSNAYSGVLCQPQDNDNDIRPIGYFSGTFTAQNKSCCATEKEAYAVLKSV